MNHTRQMIMLAVLDGKLPPEAVTMEELQEVEELLFEIMADRHTHFSTLDTIQQVNNCLAKETCV